jgi:septum formation topological specificity factor MinE
MSIEDLPDSKRDAIDLLAKAGYLKVSNDDLEVSLESADTLNIQPKGNVFGVKVKVEDDGSITPTLTFDTKKLRDNNKTFDPEGTIDDALKDFWENENV